MPQIPVSQVITHHPFIMNTPNKLLVVSSSLSPDSRSRSLARYAATQLASPVDDERVVTTTSICPQVELLDLMSIDLPIFPRGDGQMSVDKLRANFESSDAMVFACGVHNWRPCASLINYLE